MTESKWLSDVRPFDMIQFLETQSIYHRRLRLFACACLRRVWELLQRDGVRNLVTLAEEYADGKLNAIKLLEAIHSSDFDDLEAQLRGRVKDKTQLSACSLYAIYAAKDLTLPILPITQIVLETSRNLFNDYLPTVHYNETAGRGTGYDEIEIAKKTKLLREIFGNPFRPENLDEEWRSGSAITLANQMYQSRDFSEMPQLAYILQNSGCDNSDILDHCHAASPHVRGCWVVDLILNKS